MEAEEWLLELEKLSELEVSEGLLCHSTSDADWDVTWQDWLRMAECYGGKWKMGGFCNGI